MSEPEDYRITDGTRVWNFDWSERFGPSLTNGKGEIRANPWPAERSPFWRCFHLWLNQGKRWEPSGAKGVRLAIWNEPPAARYVLDPRGVIIRADELEFFDETYSPCIYVDQAGQPYSFPRKRKREAQIVKLLGLK
ncbi:hypothetical protein [Sphingobium sp. Z007]|uniref:hypothetical protein n=1 Tax=Sphingobium sp. Z007 TaxID=627495 RepID=UPI000B49ACD3|nr:hypothetical protein [Sphingobium sp. Z007]